MDMKQVLLSDLEWDFSDEDMVELKVGNTILVLTRDELNNFIESWDENWEQIYLNIVRIFRQINGYDKDGIKENADQESIRILG